MLKPTVVMLFRVFLLLGLVVSVHIGHIQAVETQEADQTVVEAPNWTTLKGIYR